MRSVVAVALLATALLLGGGCGSSSKPAEGTGDASPFAARYEAAKAITVTADRNAALVKVSADAAVAGDAETVKNCLREISVTSEKDDAAYKAAMYLAKAGKVDAATEVAKLIYVTGRRDEALGKLAKGEFGN